ncbi:diaminopimelate decarboxylase family protein [Streptomyces sp. A30]|uniref:diaminopimelate decarboxylase family protein n=1 Tax=Streptomyces sp. A30 TaxID=2789273 RepID=UPI003980C738
MTTGWDEERLADIAGRHGTPVHVLDVRRAERSADELLGALGGLGRPGRAYYSVKTNYLPHLCERFAARGLGADVVSGYELRAALRAGFAPGDIVFNGPVKTPEELALAVRNSVRVNIDGEHEIAALERAAAEAGTVAEVGIRLFPGLPVTASDDPAFLAQAERTARRGRFGWPTGSGQLARVLAAVDAARHLSLTAVHAHLGSQIVHPEPLLAALDPVLEEAARLGVREVNIGGGFGVPGILRPRGTDRSPGPGLDPASFLTAVDKRMTELGLGDAVLACEPGRLLVSDAMCLLTRVMSRKELPDARWLILDAGHHIAPWTGTGEVHRFTPLGREFSGDLTPWSLAGPLCYEADVHAPATDLPADLGIGDLLAMHDSGAYSLGRSNNFIRLRAGVVAIDGEREDLVWRAETDEDVFRFVVGVTA